MRLSLLEGVFWAIMTGFCEAYVAPFALYFHASNQQMAFLLTLNYLVGALGQIIGAAAVDYFHNRRRLCVIFSALQGLAIIPLFVLPQLLPENWGDDAIVFFWGVVLFGLNLNIPPWTSLMGDIVPINSRGDYFGRRNRINVGVIFGASLLAVTALTLTQKAGHLFTGFGIIFGTAALARFISAYLLSRHYDPPYTASIGLSLGWRDFVSKIRHTDFGRFAIFYACIIGSVTVASPYFSVYMLRDLHWSYAGFIVNNAAFMAGQTLLVRRWGQLGDRHGNRCVLGYTCSILITIPTLFAISQNYYYLLGVQVLAGIAWAGFLLAGQNYLLDCVPTAERARATSYLGLVVGFCSFCGGPIFGAFLANNLPIDYHFGIMGFSLVSSIPAVFVASSLARLATVLFLFPRVREIRSRV